MPQPANARMLAPIALVTFLLAVIVVAASSVGGDDEPSAPPPEESPSAETSTTARTATRERPPSTTETIADGGRTAIVQAGDTPTVIAEREGIALERLLELNPDINPAGLRVGQELKLEP